MKDKKSVEFHYTFTFGNGMEREFHLELDPDSLALIEKQHNGLPPWTRLSYCQCPQCTLTEEMTPWCPVAANVVELIEFFREMVSYEKVHVRIDTPERTYMRDTDIQKGVSSLMGIYTVTSGCPVFTRLRPMVRFHLPFATLEETMYRVVSMYLMRQYFRMRRGGTPDWEMKDLTDTYRDIHEVNNAFLERIADFRLKDSHVNALVILDIFASYMTFSLETDNLTKIEYLFRD
ncbi:MAG: hypothetical protein K8R90_07980 [Candidatus Cloacimonetes bacterium]|nr:hypothetical protein [Candidatus Cloacimonadota bacterium]